MSAPAQPKKPSDSKYCLHPETCDKSGQCENWLRNLEGCEAAAHKALEAQVEWNGGGHGFGICRIAAMDIWNMDRPTGDKPDFVSIVSVCGPPNKYTTEELEQIVAFAKRQTAKYDEIFSVRRGANLILLDKESPTRWMRKRMTWETGPRYAPSLDEALAIFEPKPVTAAEL